jgi:hypothetical protein
MSEAAAPVPINWQRFLTPALIAGVAGAALCGVGALVDVTQFLRSYLVAFHFWLSLAVGCLSLLLLHHLTGGRWGLVIRSILEAATRTLPLLALLFVPLALGVEWLYPWAGPEGESDPTLEHKRAYLNVTAFVVRAVVYFAIWIGIATLLNHWSRQQQEHFDPKRARQAQMFSGPAVLFHGLAITFAAIDWLMSLEPHWYSSIFGVVVGTAQTLPALAFAVLVLSVLAERPPVSEQMAPVTWQDLGNLLLAFTMMWAYIAFSQFLLIWAGNLPEETSWYIHRMTGGWEAVGWVLILFQFAMPFLLLLSRKVKRRHATLARVAVLVLVVSVLYQFWLIVPSYVESSHGHDSHPEPHLAVHWLDVAAFAGVGGLWLALFAGQLRSRPLLPLSDPDLREAPHHG